MRRTGRAGTRAAQRTRNAEGVEMEENLNRGPRRYAVTRTRRAWAASLLTGAMLTTGVAACSESSVAPGALRTLTVGVFQNPDSLDPGVTGLVTSQQILFTMFDPLMWKFPGDNKYYPGLAESFTVSPDGTRYTFHLKKDVKFHDGTPLTADAVKATFDHIADPATKSRSAMGALGPYKETRVLDPLTAEVEFSKPNAAFVDEMTTGLLAISSPTALKKYGADYGNHPVGTGPFVFKQFISDQQVVVERNPDYKWGTPGLATGPASLEKITFRVLADPSAQSNALSTGEIQVAQNLNPTDVVSAVKAGKTKLTGVSRGMPYCILVNAEKAPTNDLAVRQAIEYAVDRKAIIDTLFQGLYQPADSILTPETPGYDKSQAMYSYDKQKAAQLLDAAGWRAGSDGIRSKNGQPLKVQFINISGFGFDGISQLMQAQLRQVGIDVQITDQAFPSVATTYNQGQHNLADWFYYDVDPYLLNSVFSSSQIKSGFNWAHYSDPSVDAQIVEANATSDEAARVGTYKNVSKAIMGSATVIPIYNLQSTLVTTPTVKGIKFSLTGQPLFTAAQG
jgi:peptide/nickel transport system substrate-binding protein